MIRNSLILALSFLIVAACGGSSGPDAAFATSGEDDVVILPTYAYQVSTAVASGPLTASITGEGGLRRISIDLGNTLNGEVNIVVDADNDVEITDYTLRSASTMFVDSDAGAAFLGSFAVEVTEDFSIVAGEPPSSGVMRVTTATETVTLLAEPAGPTINVDGAVTITFTWDELEGLVDDDQALGSWRRAALAVETLEFVFAQTFAVAESLNFIDDQLATTNPYVMSCDAFTGSPPAGVIAQGEMTFTWTGSGSAPASGDDFLWTFTDCWFDDGFSSDDELARGSVALNDYIEIVDAQSTLIGTGFDEVVFNNLRISQVEEITQGIFTIDPGNTIRINGGFDLALLEPIDQE